MKCLLLSIFLLAISILSSAQSQVRYPLIPFPQQLTDRTGNFTLNNNTVVFGDNNFFQNEITQLREITGKPLKLSAIKPGKNFIEFIADKTIVNKEGYVLDVNTSRIVISASTPAGAFRALETLRQLAPVSIEFKKKSSSISIPNVLIKDFPVYSYRGMHLDVSRHFFAFGYLKKFVDRLALYKFNKLHLHLTDDQGWRIEIKKYPLLTQKGAWRRFNDQDSLCINMARENNNPDMELDPHFIKTIHGEKIYGGFYTQEEMRELVRYAAERHIDIIPEVDMPGHMDAAIQQYPFLSCSEGGWKGGPFTVPICPCKEAVIEFAENVFKEIFDIFPYEYVHLGADEVNKDSWAKFSGCKNLMKKENIKTVEELQSYFVHRMEKFFNAHGKKLIGWDEILEGGISPTANVMYWRSWMPKAPVEAAKNGNNVIMTPGEPLYFDNPPDQYSLSKVYFFNPVPKGLNPNQAKNIIGAQANIWTERIPTEARLEYMTLPRMLALPEVLWTHKQSDFEGFEKRVMTHYDRLDALNTKYRLPDINGIVEEKVFTKSAIFYPKSAAAGLVLRYTTNGKNPIATSPVLNKAIVVNKSTLFKVAAFKGNKNGDVYTVNYKQQNPIEADRVKSNHTGLAVSLFKGRVKQTSDLDKQDPMLMWEQSGWEIDSAKTNELGAFGLDYKGIINVPVDGIYTFYLTADDGAVLYISDQLVVNNDGLHSAKEKSGQIVLQKGRHSFQLKFIEGGGGYTLNLEVQPPGDSKRKKVPSGWFE
jgi:hexosaminidase